MSRALLRVLTCLLAVGLVAGGTDRVQAQTGSVEGVVTLGTRPPRRSAERYPGAATQVHAVQEVPAVVFIQGPVAGSPARPLGTRPVMEQRDTAFVPAALVVPVGTTVRFPNGDPFFHNVFSYSSPARFDLGRYPRGEAKEVTFDKPGIVKVYCEVHEFMRAIIAVTESPFAAVADGEGRFRITGIPEGTYTFVVWHPDLDPVERQVGVRAGQVTRLDAELR
ncbi:MAG: hypothetical protein AMXMBFR53_33070 [Gemmatimonadota bacterium]